ncbi:MAG: tol-pal system-associated acyl-CoA thioesterase [Betaproteobacteria bacterium]
MNSRSEPRAGAAGVPRAQPFSWPIRVYYEDTDSGGIVYYANYLKFMERARTEWLRALGFTQRDLAEREGVVFVVRALGIEYLRPSRFDDSLQVTVEPVKVGAGQIVVAQEVRRAAELLASAEVRLACVNVATMRPVRIPQAVLIKTGTIS